MQPATAADQHGHKGSDPWEMRFVTKEARPKNKTEHQERALVQKHNENNQEEKNRQPQLAVMMQQGTMLNYSRQLREAESEPLFITTIINVFELVRPLIWKKNTQSQLLCAA